MVENLIAAARRALSPLLPPAWRSDTPVVPVVRLTGAIGMNTPFRQSLTLSSAARPLERAFSMKSARAVALVINSPGGSPVQSHLIHKRIRSLAAEHDKPVIAFVEDVAASGGYMIACAADEIVADPSSVVGSIGVVSAGFGFDKLLDRIGVDRRVHTAGTRKMMLDPFRPERPEDVERLEALQREIHKMFVDLVRGRRADTLSGSDEALFSGEFWVGGSALSLGLVDHLSDLRTFLRMRYGDTVRTPLIGGGGLFGRRAPGIEAGAPGGVATGAAISEGLMAAVEERSLWARYGL